MDFAEPEPREELPPPPTITEAQRLEARDLFHRLSDDGIETSIDELASVLNEVKLWMNGVEHIQDAETQVRSANFARRLHTNENLHMFYFRVRSRSQGCCLA